MQQLPVPADPGSLLEGRNRRSSGILARRLQFDPSDKEAMSTWDTTENFHFFDVFFLAFNLFLGLLGVLTLVVGASACPTS